MSNMKEQEKVDAILVALDDMDNEEYVDQLQKGAEFFCGLWDIGYGYKQAISATVNDQYNNHAGENDLADYDKLLEILTTEK